MDGEQIPSIEEIEENEREQRERRERIEESNDSVDSNADNSDDNSDESVVDEGDPSLHNVGGFKSREIRGRDNVEGWNKRVY